jgi:hypothetical protein
VNFAIAMKQTRKAGRGDGKRHRLAFAQYRRHERQSAKIYQDPLPELQGVEIRTVATNRDLVIRAAIGVFEYRPSDALAR